MAFLLLLLVSLSTLIRVETATTERSNYQIEAEQNALLGIKTALGQLQKLAGPDQRVTAPANIDENTANGKQYWTGVWRSGTTGGATANDFEGWLVSLPDGVGNTLDQREAADVNWSDFNPEWVTLVGAGTVEGGQQADYVVAGKVSIDQTGHYAYWTGEENTKARVNLSTPANVAALDSDLMAPRYTGFTSVDTGFGSLTASDTNLEKLTSLSDLNNLTGVAHGLDQLYFHDLSTHGRGVQADVKNGGLKKDLTHLLESDTAFTRYFGLGPTDSPRGIWPEPYTFHDADESYNFPYGAPNWGILASYYRLYEDISNGAIAPRAPYEQPKSATQNNYHGSGEIYQYNQPVHAVVSMFRLALALEYRRVDKTDSDGNPVSTPNPDGSSSQVYIYRPILHIKPLIALYNPYDIALVSNQYDINWGFMPTITITVNGEDVVFNLQEVLPESPDYGSMFRWSISQDTDLQPGETRYYALNQAYEMSNSVSNYDFAQMEAAWQEDGAYLIDLTQWRVGNANVSSDKRFIVRADTDGNTVSLYSTKSTRNKDEDKKSPRFGLTDAEVDKLIIETSDVPPPVEVVVYYGNVEVGEVTETPMGTLALRFRDPNGTNTAAQLIDSYYQETNNNRYPDSAVWGQQILNLVDNPSDIDAVAFSLRTTTQTDEPHRQLIDANPRALMLSGKIDGFRSGDGLTTFSGWTMTEYEAGESLEPQIADLTRYTGFWGNTRELNVDNSMAASASSVMLYHVPRQPLISLGTFQHAGLGRYSYQPAYIFGNSYATSKIPSTATRSTYEEYTRTRYAYDWSYAINDAVWDSYYFSTVPQDDDEAEALIGEIEAKTATLPNPRFSLYSPEGYDLDNASLANLLTDDSVEDTAEITAAFQLTDGMFNVNSTSVEAWKAFLGSNSHLDVPIYNPATGLSNTTVNEAEAVFFRSPLPYDNGFLTQESGQNFWNAYRKLTDVELTELATAIVEEVRLRGPFSSLGDFVNRRPGSADPEQRRRGPLQAALDTTVNQPLDTGLVGTVTGDNLAIPDFAGDVYNATDTPGTGMPGWILQGDVLQALGPLMSVRSDTFRIRAYGDRTNPLTGDVLARAWCEVVVQRVPDPVMTTGNAPTREELATPPTDFGRQFRIVTFRWLNNDDV
ncbi:MAG: hypothetical protein Q7Q73_03550 [Verrucomicrobiota bacterium JB024]|nr:hypothetical protein [Verrucomicrobiota bacterium JB024]